MVASDDRLEYNAEEEMIEAYEDAEQAVPPVQDLFPLSHKMARDMGVKPDRLQVGTCRVRDVLVVVLQCSFVRPSLTA